MKDPMWAGQGRAKAFGCGLLLVAMLVAAGVARWDAVRFRTAQTAGEVAATVFPVPALPEPVRPVNAAPPTDPAPDPAVRRHADRTSQLYRPIIHRAADRYRVDPAVVQAIIMAESAFDPRAVSRRGARGLMQLMPATAAWLGVEDSFDPARNIDAGVRYLRHLMDRCDDDLTLALAAYNAGLHNVRRYRGVPPIRATRRYVHKVMAYYRCYRRLGARRET